MDLSILRSNVRPVLVYGNKLAPRAVCLLTIVRLLGPFTLSKVGVLVVEAGVGAVVGVVVDIVEVGREPFDDGVTVVEVVAVGVGDLTDVCVSVIALLFKLSIAVNFAAVTLFVDVVVILDGVVVVVNLVVVVVVVWQANSEQRHW